MSNIPGTLTNSIFTGMGPWRLEPQAQAPVLPKFKSKPQASRAERLPGKNDKANYKQPHLSPELAEQINRISSNSGLPATLRSATAPVLGSGTFPLWTC